MKKSLTFAVIFVMSLVSNMALAADSVETSGQEENDNFFETLFNVKQLSRGCHTYPDCPPAELEQIQLEPQAVYNASSETDDEE